MSGRKTTAPDFIDAIRWDELEHAYGPASDIPDLLRKVAAAKGRKLHEALGDLCNCVFHQGTLYSASSPSVRAVIEILSDAAPREKAIFYGFLAEIASCAVDEGSMPSDCGAGQEVYGDAILKEFRDVRARLVPDLSHRDAQIRSAAVAVIASIAGDDETSANLVRERYLTESDPRIRHTILAGLKNEALGFWNAALERESEPANRFLIRCAQVQSLPSAADAACVDDLVSSMVPAYGSEEFPFPGEVKFFDAVHLLGADRELVALLKAFELARDHELLRVLAERLLRIAFADKRTGWGYTTHSRLNEDGSEPPQMSISRMAFKAVGHLLLYKLFPRIMRWRIRRKMRGKLKGISKVNYSSLTGPAPEIRRPLNEAQRAVLTSFASKAELWEFRTNLWELFGLPATSAGLQSFMAVE